MTRAIRKVVKKLYLSPITNPMRPFYQAMVLANRYFGHRIGTVFAKSFQTGETSNFTYDLTDANLGYLAHVIALVTGEPLNSIRHYLQEPRDDQVLRRHVLDVSHRHGERDTGKDLPFGRRLGWYAMARAIKPKVVVETGVDRGHGAVLLCAALVRNAQEGAPGRYFGTDISSRAGWLLDGIYAQTGKILYGDSIASLRGISDPIDLFINDSDHSADYEYQEYIAIKDKLSPRAFILGDNAHVTDRLMRFSDENGRRFLFFREEPKNHWYPGAGIGISFTP